MADIIKGEMIRGQIDTVILLALTDGDKDSNDIRSAIEEKSDNQYSIKQGTFYSAMQRLVKQGLIKEYRSSALDGIRRKYYSLTQKGTKYLDKNREQWSVSKALVDNLIDAEPVASEPKREEQPPKIVDEFDSFKALVENSDESFSIESATLDESYFDVIGADVLSDLEKELEKPEIKEEALKPVQTEELPLPATGEKLDKIEDNSSDFIDDYLSISNRTKDELFSFEMDEEEGFESLEIPEEEPEIQEETPPTIPTMPVEEEPIQVATDSEPDQAEEDDHLVVEEYTPTNRNKYKQILNSILPKAQESTPERIEERNEQVSLDDYQSITTNEAYELERQKNAEIYEQMRAEQVVERVEVKEEKVERRQINSDPSDFSDLYAMANREGFKIRTSHNTNKFAGNGILINKLRMHGALLFLILLFVEGLVLNFALSSILQWNPSVKFIILGCLAIFPAITLVMYLLSSKRVVSEISSFKDAMGVALIITFQMTIIILCVALFVSVDFNNFKEVCTFILLPFILALNVPIYFILKYSLLSTGKYFTE